MKQLISLLLVFCLIFLTACTSGDNETTGTEGGDTLSPSAVTDSNEMLNTVETTAPVATIAPAVLSEDEIYNNFLQNLCIKLRNIILDDTHLDGFSDKEGMIGVSEIASNGGTDMLKKMGYTIRDINHDGVLELIICQTDDPNQETCTGGRILCAYTVAENKEVLLFEGNSQNRYYLLDDGLIYNESSESETCLGFGLFEVNPEGTAVSCADFYIMDLTEDQNGKFYHNQSGQFDLSASEPLEIDKKAYDAMQTDYVSRVQRMDLSSLDAIEG